MTLAFALITIPRNSAVVGCAVATFDYIIPSYKRRWRIETGFQVQDEARIMSKSKDISIRYFYFAYEQVLQLLWVVLYKDEVSFKVFMIDIYEMYVA